MIIAGMALLFPTAFAFYLGVKMVFAAYREYRSWREEREARIKQALAEARAEGRVEGLAEARAEGRAEARAKGRDEGLAEGRDAERNRLKREFAARGIVLPPEAERILYGEPDPDTENAAAE